MNCLLDGAKSSEASRSDLRHSDLKGAIVNRRATWKMIFCLAAAWACLAKPGVEKGTTDRLTDDADAVVVGEVQSGQQTGSSLTFALSISRVIKGDVTSGTTINVTGNTRLSLTRTVGGHYGLWFLKKAGGQWLLIPGHAGGAALETSGYFPLSKVASPAMVQTTSAPATMSDHIAVELAGALYGYTNPSQIFNLAYG